jgi:prolyl oligopeptidase
MHSFPKSLIAAALAFAVTTPFAGAPKYPESAKKPVTDEYFGSIKVTDDYRWLEDRKDPAVAAWTAEQNRFTRSTLDALSQRKALLARFRELMGSEPVSYSKLMDRGSFFALKRQPPRNQPQIVVMKAPGDTASERVVVDPLKIDPRGTTAIDFYVPSLDGKYIAVALSEGGSEDGAAEVFEVASSRKLSDHVPRVQYPTGGGSIAWDEKGTGFYYTRYPQGNERAAEDANFYQQVYFHKLGTPASADTYEIGKEFPRIAEIELESSRDGRYVLATVANGDGGEYAYWVKGAKGWTKVADFADKVKRARIGRDGNLYLLSLKDAPRGKVLAVALEQPAVASAKVAVAQGEATMIDIDVARERLFVTCMVGGPSELRVFDLAGKALGPVPTEAVSTVDVGAVLDDGGVLVSVESYVSPKSWFRYSASDGKLAKVTLGGERKVSFDDAEVVREMAVSKDGTKVPVNIIMKKGTKLDGSNPAILYGYGGYGLSMTPQYSVSRRIWLDHGGIFVVANLRGGGEFGEAWHLAGNLTKKQAVFDDMIGAARHLIARGYTKPERLAAMGGSNGGLLMGAMITQAPELFRAVVSFVGIYDMLRVELTPNGAFNVTEFGTVKDRAQFDALYAYSPQHRVKDGAAYPAVLLASGANDGRVDPYNSRKFVARLQAASTSGRPVLLRLSGNTGHGQGTALGIRIEEFADVYTFLFDQLGMK